VARSTLLGLPGSRAAAWVRRAGALARREVLALDTEAGDSVGAAAVRAGFGAASA